VSQETRVWWSVLPEGGSRGRLSLRRRDTGRSELVPGVTDVGDRRREIFELLGRIRAVGSLPHEVFQLLELIVEELDQHLNQHEAPTNPGGRPTPAPMPRVSPTPFRKAGEILADALEAPTKVPIK
jgi:hypothetical protein